jgi:hypothetical protein
MKTRLFLWIAVLLVALPACGPREDFTSRAVYEPLSPLFEQVVVEVSGSLNPENNLSQQTEAVLTFISSQGDRSVLQLEGRNGNLYLKGGVPGSDLSNGDRLDADHLRQVMIASGVVMSGQFKQVDAQELYGFISAWCSGPGAELPEPVRYRLAEGSVTYANQ